MEILLLQNGFFQIMLIAMFSLAFFTLLGLVYPIVANRNRRREDLSTTQESLGEYEKIKDIFIQEIKGIREEREENIALIKLYKMLRNLILDSLKLSYPSPITEKELALKLSIEYQMPEFYEIYEDYERVRFGNNRITKEQLNYLLSLSESILKKIESKIK
ncbi:MAG: hypothetical protein QXX95_06220 [Nitrososphaerales archaeon]